MSNLTLLFLTWGVWLIVPILTDGLSAIWSVLLALRYHSAKQSHGVHDTTVSVIVPAYNEELNIDRCILSILAQSYPHRLIEIVIVDDGSSDNTVNRVFKYLGVQSTNETLRTSSFAVRGTQFNGTLNVVRRKRGNPSQHGKAMAVNLGISVSTGDLVFSIDADVVLAPKAIENAVIAFADDPTIAAASGHLIIDPYLSIKVDKNNEPLFDDYGMTIPKDLSRSEMMLTACQFIEYLTTFHLGRSAESVSDTMFTMSGACAIVKRNILEQVGQYQGRTVSEDTDMTMAIHQLAQGRIAYLRHTEIHLAPTLSWADLYSQRVRWQRGALEVVAAYKGHTIELKRSLYWRLAVPLRMQVDHTLAMPRIVWSFVIFLLPLFGYSWVTIRDAFIVMFLFYIVVNLFRLLSAYAFSSPPEKVFARRYMGYVIVLPLYNMFLFWTRMSGILRTLTEDASWRVESQFLRNLENGTYPRSTLRALRTTTTWLMSLLRF